MPDGTLSCETKFYRESHADSSGATWSEVGNLLAVGFPDKSREMIDITHLNATDRYRVFKGGFRDPGRVRFRFLFSGSGYAAMNTDYESDHMQQYKIVLPDADSSEFVFNGMVEALGSPGAEGSNALIVEGTIKLSGKPTTEPT